MTSPPYGAAPVALHVLDTGAPPDARLPPLVLLHGIGASGEDWEFQVPAFAPYCRVIVPDLRGFGRSPRGERYTIDAFAADVWAALDGLGVQHFNLVGHSMGGAVALCMAVTAPERIQRLVLADTLPSFEVNSFGKLSLYLYRLIMMRLFGPARLSGAVARALFPKPEQAALRARMAVRNMRHDRSVYLHTLRGIKGWTVADRLSRLIMPTLVLAAEHDYFPRADAEAFAAALPNARLQIFPDTHHHLPMEIPQAFNAQILKFLTAPMLQCDRH